MIPTIEAYAKIIGKEKAEHIKAKAEKFRDRHIVHVSSSYMGGGVAEILRSLVMLLGDLDIRTGWRLLKGTYSFFNVTKQFHNGLQGGAVKLSNVEKSIYFEEIERNTRMNHFIEHDLVIMHDPQPLAMIKHYRKKQPWIWRCHIDITKPNKNVWNFLFPYINKYDGVILSMDEYRKRQIKAKQHIIPPSIDPLSLKNINISKKHTKCRLVKNNIDPDRPFIAQISRFDKWKDPLGVLEIFKKVKEKIPKLQLVLMGDMAMDDPEGVFVYNSVLKKAKGMKDVIILNLKDDMMVNILQREADVILQNSKKEGFALTISEALWKGTPVISRPVGGIPLQVKNGRNGYLVNSNSEAAKKCIKLLKDPDLIRRFGKEGREHVRNHFLITRHVEDYLNLIEHYTKEVK